MQHSTPGNLLRESNSSQIFTRALYPQNFPDSYRKSPTECQSNWDTLCHPTSLGFSLSWRGLSYKVWFNSMPMRWTLPDPYPRIPYYPGTRPPGDTPQSTGHILGPPRLSTSLLVTARDAGSKKIESQDLFLGHDARCQAFLATSFCSLVTNDDLSVYTPKPRGQPRD